MFDQDFAIANHGSIVTFAPHTDAALDWWEENVGEAQAYAGAFVAEHRYAGDIIDGIANAGLTIG